MTTEIYKTAWENLNGETRTVQLKNDRFNTFASPKKVGEVYPIATIYRESMAPNYGGITKLAVYIGKHILTKEQKHKYDIFAVKSEGEKYILYLSPSGKFIWTCDGEDEPFIPAGIGVNFLWVANPENSKEIQKRFGKKLNMLERLTQQGERLS